MSAPRFAADCCPRCGSPRHGNDQCHSCGLEFTCHSCGAAYESPLADRFCAECGERVVRHEIDPDAVRPKRAGARPAAGADHQDPPAPEPVGALRSAAGRARELAGAATLAGGRLSVPRSPRRRSAKRTVRRSVGELELELSCVLLATGRIREARRAFRQALQEGATDRPLLRSLAAEAARADTADVAVRALLELTILEPEGAAVDLRAAVDLVDPGSVERHGVWILSSWYPLMSRRHGDHEVRARSGLLACRVAMLTPDEHVAEACLRDAWAADSVPVTEAAESLLRADFLAVSIRGTSRGDALLARLQAAVHHPQSALEHIAAALAGEDLPHEDQSALFALRGQQLLALKQPGRAAASYVEAGRLAELAARHRHAVEHFQCATEADPANSLAFWYLGDALRLTADAPAYPYVDGDVLERARAAWQRGMRLSPPVPGQSWVHLTGALIFEQLARMSENASESIVRATLQAEQACALDQDSADAWAMVARFHRIRRRFSVAAHALNHALTLDPRNANANFERVMSAVMTADPGAIDILDAYERGFVRGRSPVITGLRGYALMLGGDLPAACEQLQLSVTEEPTDIWVRTRLALCLALGGDVEASKAQAAEAESITAGGRRALGPMHADVRALTGLLTSSFDEAEEQFGVGMAMAWANPVEVRLGRAIASQMRGDPGDALAMVQAAAHAVRHAGDVQLAQLYLGLLRTWGKTTAAKRLSREWASLHPDSQPAATAAAGPAILELEQAGQLDQSVTMEWLAVRAGVGRILAAEERWQDAASADERLTGFDDALEGVPAVRHRLVAILHAALADPRLAGDLASMHTLTDRLAELEQLTGAEQALALATAARSSTGTEAGLAEAERAAELAQASHDRRSLRRARALQGEILIEAGRVDEARHRFQQALATSEPGFGHASEHARIRLRLAGVAAHAGQIFESFRELRSAFDVLAANHDPADAARELRLQITEILTADEPAAFSAAFRALFEDPDLTGRQRRTLASTRFALRRSTETAERLDQISVQGSPSVFPDDLSDRSAHLIRDGVSALRRRLLGVAGVRIPGVAVGPDAALDGYRYWLLIHGVPYHEGVLAADARLVIGDTGEVCGHRVRNAWSGIPAVWSAEAVDGLTFHEGILWLLEGVLRANLAHFVTLPEVEHQLEAWQASGGTDRAALLAAAVRSRRHQTRLVAVIGRLAREQVPVNSIGTIIDVFGSMGPEVSIGALTEATRARLIDVLPGSDGDRELVFVPPQVVDILSDADGPLPRPTANLIIRALRETIGDRAAGQFALVVHESERRAAVQTMCERILSSVAVLSAAEVSAFEWTAVPA